MGCSATTRQTRKQLYQSHPWILQDDQLQTSSQQFRCEVFERGHLVVAVAAVVVEARLCGVGQGPVGKYSDQEQAALPL